MQIVSRHRIAVASALALFALSAAQAQTLDKVKASGSITVAYRESSIPFSYLDDKAQPTGFGWEICQRIVDEVKRATGRADLKVATLDNLKAKSDRPAT